MTFVSLNSLALQRHFSMLIPPSMTLDTKIIRYQRNTSIWSTSMDCHDIPSPSKLDVLLFYCVISTVRLDYAMAPDSSSLLLVSEWSELKYSLASIEANLRLSHGYRYALPPHLASLSRSVAINFLSELHSVCRSINLRASPFFMSASIFIPLFSLMDNYMLHSLEQKIIETFISHYHLITIYYRQIISYIQKYWKIHEIIYIDGER